MDLNSEQVEVLLGRVLELARPRETEVILGGGTCTVTRFANNRFHQNVCENRLQLCLRVIEGRRTGAVTIDDFSDDSIRRGIFRANEIAKHSDEMEDLLPLLGSEKYKASVGRFDPTLAKFNLDQVSIELGEFFSRCESNGYRAAGKLEIIEGTIGDYGEISPLAMANSKGLFVFSPSTWIDFSTTVFSDVASGWSGNAAHRKQWVSIDEICGTAFAKAKLNVGAKDLSPGGYTVIFEPAAVLSLVAYLAASFNAQEVKEGRSFLVGKMGERIFPEWFSLSDDAYHEAVGGCPFDGEGVPTKRVPLIERGTLRSLVYTRALAREMKHEPTGHGWRVPNPFGAVPRHLVMSGGEKDLNGLIAGTKDGLLVTRIWYTTPVDEKQLIISGMTRDGTFLIKEGAIVGCVKNLRFNQSVPEMIGHIVEASRSVPCSGAMIPALKVDRFKFTSTAPF